MTRLICQRRAVVFALTLLLLASSSPITLLSARTVLPTQATSGDAQFENLQATATEGESHTTEAEPPSTPSHDDGEHDDLNTHTRVTLQWATPSASVGVPVTASIRVEDELGETMPVAGSILLDLTDGDARVANAEVLPISIGQRVVLPLVDGEATATITFATAGSHRATATIEGDHITPGPIEPIQVSDVFFAIHGPAAAAHAQRQRFIIIAQDDQGKRVHNYAGEVVVTTDDAGALVTDLSGQEQAHSGMVVHRFDPAENGQIQVEIAFSTSGKRTIEAHDTANEARGQSREVVVSGNPAGTAPAGSQRAFASLVTMPLSMIVDPSFMVTLSTASTQAGVPLSITVEARNADGTRNTGFLGTVKFTATDATFSPGAAYRYTFTTADAGLHTFGARFNTAGAAQRITVTYTVNSAMTGTSPTVSVAETFLHASFASNTVQEDTSINMTVEARDSAGNLVAGYRGTVMLSSTWNGVPWYSWGAGVSGSAYTFTATDAGQHTLTPKLSYAGDQRVTITDKALASRTVTTDVIAVTNAPAPVYAHASAPAGIKLADGTVLWASLGVGGRLSVRRAIGASDDPLYRPAVVARAPASGQPGADSPNLVRFGSTLVLFHTFTDGTYFQVWYVTSTDDGDTWSEPVKVTQEPGHVARVRAVVDGSTLHLFWTRHDTNQKLFHQTTTDLAMWSPTATVSQAIGVPVDKTTPSFSIAKLASGAWLLGWLWTSTVNEVSSVANNLSYPTVHVASSADLTTWTSPIELNLPWSERWPESVALAQEPGSGLIYAAFEQYDHPWDTYLVVRTSMDGATWNTKQAVGYDRSAPADGSQGYRAEQATLVPGSMLLGGSVQAGGGLIQGYGRPCTQTNACSAMLLLDLNNLSAEPMPAFCGAQPPTADCPTGECVQIGQPVNALTGYQSTSATDLAFPTRGMPLVASRAYSSYDGVLGHDGAFGIGWSWSYGVHAVTLLDGSVAIVEANGRRAVFWKTGSTWTPDSYINATLTAATGGGYTLTRHDQSVWTFDAAGLLVSIADRNGNVQTLSYTSGRLAAVAAPGGRTLTVTTDTNGHITRIEGPGGLAATYTYDASGHLVTATDPASATTTYTYDSRHQMLTVVDANGQTVESNTYGSLGRVKSQRDAAGQQTTFTYGEQTETGTHDPSKVIDPRGNHLWIYNDASLRMTDRSVYANGTIFVQRERWTYDSNGNVTQFTDGNGKIHTYSYDSRGNMLTEMINSGAGGLNLTSTYTYDSANNLLSATDPRGQTTSFTYDTTSNLLTVTNPLSQTTTFAYNGNGELTSVTNALNQTTTFGYSTAGDLTTVTEPGSIVTTLGYDTAGRLTSTTDPLTHTTTLTVNGRGQPTSVTNALSQTTNYGYDAVGNLTTVTDPLSRTTTYAYDNLNRLTSVTDAMSPAGVTSYAYDAASNLTRVTDANGRQTNYTYDALNRPLTVTDALNKTTSYTYDKNSNVTQTLDANGVKNTYVYDAANRLTGIDLAWVSGTPVADISYAYDAASRRSSMTDSTGTTTYSYDNANQLLSVSAPVTGTVSYTYDALGRRSSLLYPGQTTPVTYAYTARGQLDTVTDWLSNVTDYGYDAAGRLTDIAYPNGVDGTLGYDDADRLTGIDYVNSGTTLETIGYTLDAAGIRTQMVDSTGTTSWGYDALSRLTSVDYPVGDDIGYTYDAVGNRETLTVGTIVSDYSYNTLNQLTAIDETDDGIDDITYGYDANGNQTGKIQGGTTTSYGWDALNRLTSVTTGGSTIASYAYNGDGLRTRKTVGATTTDFTWDPTGLGTVIHVDDGTVDDEYLWGVGLVGRIDGNGAETYAHSDGLGSIRSISDSTGVEVGTTEYDAFGATRSTTGVQYSFGFTGEQVDAETGFVYLRARYLDPGTGRFISQDPIGLAGGDVNLYGYVWNTPTAYVDPSGLQGDYLDAGGGSGGFGGPFIGPVLAPGAAAALAKLALLGAIGPAYYYADDAVDLFAASCEAASSVASSFWNFLEGDGVNSKDLKKLSDDEIDILDGAGFHPHDIKVGLGPGAFFDLYKDKKGNIYIWRKGGKGVPDPTGINIKDIS